MATTPSVSEQSRDFLEFMDRQRAAMLGAIVDTCVERVEFYRSMDRNDAQQSLDALLSVLFDGWRAEQPEAVTERFNVQFIPLIQRGVPFEQLLEVPAIIRQRALEFGLPAVTQRLTAADAGLRRLSATCDYMVTQIGQLVRTNAELARNRAGYHRLILDRIIDGIVVNDLQSVVTYANPAFVKLMGYEGLIEGRSMYEFLDPAIIESSNSENFPALLRDGFWRGITTYLRADGSLLAVESATSLIIDETGTLVGAVTIVRDMTKEREAEAERLRLQDEIIRIQEAALVELSTPLIPISDHVVVMPLIGTIDSRRAQQVLESLLHGIETHRAQVAILDITGVSVVDTQVANALIRAAQSARLLGARVILTGIGPEIAQTLVGLGASMNDIITLGTLQSAIAFANSIA